MVLAEVRDFQLRDKYMFATKVAVSRGMRCSGVSFLGSALRDPGGASAHAGPGRVPGSGLQGAGRPEEPPGRARPWEGRGSLHTHSVSSGSRIRLFSVHPRQIHTTLKSQ